MADKTLKTLTLPGTGQKMPTLAYGTWSATETKPGEVCAAVKAAIDAGYRHIDCALCYGNEAEVGQAIAQKMADKTVKREDLFITTKVWNNYHAKDRVKIGAQKSLKDLQLTYCDLILVHWPTAFKDGDELFPKGADGKLIFAKHDLAKETWKGMEDLVDAGLARNIGVSNFNSQQLQRVLDNARIKPVNLQIEVNPTFTNEKMVAFAKSKGLTVSCYAPLGSPGRSWKESGDPNAMEDPAVKSIATKHKKTPAQVLIRWHLQLGLALCVKSFTPERIRQNIDVFNFELAKDEIAKISGLNKNFRLFLYPMPGVDEHPEYPFKIEF